MSKCLACNGTGKFTEQQSPNEYLLAYWRHVKKREPQIPEGSKNLSLKMIHKLLFIVADIAGKMELSYRRGIQDGEERSK